MRLVLVGAGGQGKVVADIACLLGKYKEIIFLDDNDTIEKCLGYKVVGVEDEYSSYLDEKTEFFVSIGKSHTRKRIQERILDSGGKIATLIHPKSIIGKDVSIGLGTVVMAGAVIGSGAQISKGCIINTLSSVDHDSYLGEYCHLAPGAHVCGMVEIKDNVVIGAGTVIRNGIKICSDCIFGEGAVVIRDITIPGYYVGVPSERITIESKSV